MATLYGPKIITDGIVYLVDATCLRSFNGIDGSSSWTDIVGDTNGTLTNGPGYSPEEGGYIKFDGSNDYHSHSVKFPIIDPSNGLTMMGWYNMSYAGAAILLSYNKPSSNNGMRMQFSSNFLSMTYGSVADYTFPSIAQSSLVNSKWRHICITTLGTTASAYIDGTFNSSISIGTASIADLSEVIISKTPDSTGGRFTGGVSSACIYNRALTSTEVKQNFNATKARFEDHQPTFELKLD